MSDKSDKIEEQEAFTIQHDSQLFDSISAQDFEPADIPRESMESIQHPSMSFFKEALLRVKSSKLAITCIVFLLLMFLGAIFVPMISSFNYAGQNVDFGNQPPLSIDPISGRMHWFGTDILGRDIFVRIWYGARISLLVAVVVTLIDCFVGVVYGGVAGYFGGMVDQIMMRILEVISGIPYLIIVLLMLVVLPRGIGTIILAYSLTGWTGMARLVRGQVIRLSRQEYIITAKVMGASAGRIIFYHFIPNIMSVIIISITIDIPGIIFTEAFLSMLGLGIAPPQPSWGILANEGVAAFQNYPSQLLFPALFICFTMLSFHILGDKLQDAFNPRLRRSKRHG